MSDIAWAIIIVALLFISAPAWVPLLFLLGGLILGALVAVCVFLFVSIATVFDAIGDLMRKAARKKAR